MDGKCQGLPRHGLEDNKRAAPGITRAHTKFSILKRTGPASQFLILSPREGRKEPQLLFPAQTWPLLLTPTEFYLMKVPFQEQLFLKTFKTKMRVYVAVKYVKLFTASALKRSAVLLVEEHLDWRNKKK